MLVVAAVLGVGSVGTFALWRDSEHGTLQVRTGVVLFGAQRLTSGVSGDTAGAWTYAASTAAVSGRPGVNEGSVTVSFGGPAQATALYGAGLAGGSVAIPVQVDSLAQGHRGLSYQVTTTLAGGIFGASTVTVYKVASAAACTTATAATVASSSAPWSTAYTASTTPLSEYWCLVAKFVPKSWTHTDTASVTATGPGTYGPVAANSNSWTATSRQTFVPANEPTHTLTFTFRTYRPGTTPW